MFVEISTKKFLGRGERWAWNPVFLGCKRQLRPPSGEIPRCLRIVFNWFAARRTWLFLLAQGSIIYYQCNSMRSVFVSAGLFFCNTLKVPLHLLSCSYLIIWCWSKNQARYKKADYSKVYNVQCTVYNVQCTMYSVQCKVYSVQCTMYNVQLYSHKNWFQMPCLRFLVAVLTFLDGRPSDDSNSVNGRLIVVKTSFSKFGQKPPKCCRVLQSKREKPLTEMSGFEIWIPPWLMGSSSSSTANQTFHPLDSRPVAFSTIIPLPSVSFCAQFILYFRFLPKTWISLLTFLLYTGQQADQPTPRRPRLQLPW